MASLRSHDAEESRLRLPVILMDLIYNRHLYLADEPRESWLMAAIIINQHQVPHIKPQITVNLRKR